MTFYEVCTDHDSTELVFDSAYGGDILTLMQTSRTRNYGGFPIVTSAEVVAAEVGMTVSNAASRQS